MNTRSRCTGVTLGVIFAAMLVLQGCAETVIVVGAGAAVMSATDRRSTGAQVDDEGIELRTTNRIDERFGDKVHVNVTSFNYVVLLTGEVPDAGTRAEIEKIARGAGAVRSVTNEAQISGVSSFGARTNDSYITSKVKARFLDVGRFKGAEWASERIPTLEEVLATVPDGKRLLIELKGDGKPATIDLSWADTKLTGVFTFGE